MRNRFSFLPCGLGRRINIQYPSSRSCNGRIACLPLFHGLKEVSDTQWRLSGLYTALMLALCRGCFSDWMTGGLYHIGISLLGTMGGSFENSRFCRLGILSTLFTTFLGTLPSWFFAVVYMFGSVTSAKKTCWLNSFPLPI